MSPVTRDALKGAAVGVFVLCAYVVAADYPPQGGSGGASGDFTAGGDSTFDSLTLDEANADVAIVREQAGWLRIVDAISDAGPTASVYAQVLRAGNSTGVGTATLGLNGANNEIRLASAGEVVFTNGTDVDDTQDTFIGRNAAGEVYVGATTGTADGKWLSKGLSCDTSGTSYATFTDAGADQGLWLASDSEIIFRSSTDADSGNRDTYIRREAAGAIHLGERYGGGMVIYSAGELLSDVSLDAVTENLAPAGSRIIAVSTRVKTAVVTSSATNTFSAGDGSDVDRYGADIAGAGNTTSDSTDATADPMSWSASAHGAVTLTPPGAESFSSGAVYVVVHYLASSAPTSTP